jgi:hypothetical protein
MGNEVKSHELRDSYTEKPETLLFKIGFLNYGHEVSAYANKG